MRYFFKTLALIISLLILFPMASHSQFLSEEILKLMRVLNLVENNYVDTVNKYKITEAAVVGMLKELDPHSFYITKEELQKVNEDMSGAFEGVGVQFNIMDDTLMVVSAITGGPSEKVGILAGDRIVTVDSENIAGVGINNDKVFKLLRGPKGTKVDLGIKRKGVQGVETYTVIRDKIPINSLDAAYMINENTAYVKLNRFSATTMKEYREAMSKLTKQGAKHLILDLTNNGGGFLDMSTQLVDEYLDKDKLIVYTEGEKSPKEVMNSTSRGSMETGKIVVMVDEGSASASEIVSGAIQDWDRGVIVGRRTFGKGLVQKQYPLNDGSAIRLTVARYHTPTGRVIQRPYGKNDKEYHKDLSKRYQRGEMFSADSINFPDSLKYSTLRLKRTVYGGGGIMPDMFVAIDTSYSSDFLKAMNRRGIQSQFVLNYIDRNREELTNKYSDFSHFLTDFKVDENIMKELIEHAEKSNIKPKDGDIEISGRAIELQLKALFARNLFEQDHFYQIINEIDPIYNAAVEIITNDNLYNQILNKK
ncbi:MAG: S41 family peptidase [Salinivirgaceae bacterium]|jgi:carboxyl-terminal processing protease|nr:S41 family peptidase [Bacteroidales bacterium]